MTASVPPGAGPVPAELFAAFCDDAAVFPPGELPLAQAVPAHLRHVTAAHAPLVGPLVVPQARLPELAELTAGHERQSLNLAVTVPSPEAAGQALASVAALPTARLRVLEVAVPEGVPTAEIVPRLTTALRNADDRTGVTVYVEVPRDERRPGLIASLADSPSWRSSAPAGCGPGCTPTSGNWHAPCSSRYGPRSRSRPRRGCITRCATPTRAPVSSSTDTSTCWRPPAPRSAAPVKGGRRGPRRTRRDHGRRARRRPLPGSPVGLPLFRHLFPRGAGR
ncbi:hypothetical protein ACFQVA_40145 [Actinomadura keratinilytica]